MSELPLRAIFNRALRASDPYPLIRKYLPKNVNGRVVVVGAGKASARMALAVEDFYQDCSGVIVVPYGTESGCKRLDTIFAGHPVPDSSSLFAAKRLLETVDNLREQDLVIALISGGGSSLVCYPPPGISLAEKQTLTKALLASGASISEINAVRREISRIKGGRLALAAAPATLITLIISDVPGNYPEAVASGPTIPSAASPLDIRHILGKYRIPISKPVEKYLTERSKVVSLESNLSSTTHIVLSGSDMLRSAEMDLSSRGISVKNLGDAVQGSSQEVAKLHAEKLMKLPLDTVLLSGGELTVKLDRNASKRRGGRNTEYLLALALELENKGMLYGIACDSDGLDGSSGAAGAMVTPKTIQRMRQAGIVPEVYLEKHAAAEAFQLTEELIKTGPTGTNLNDFRCAYLSSGDPPRVRL